MHRRRRTVSLAVALAAVLSTAACTSSDTEPASSAAGTSSAGGSNPAASTSPGVYGAPVDPSAADPTDFATDSPARSTGSDSDSAGGDGDVSVLLTYSGWNASAAQVEVDGYVPGVAEDGGTCLLTLTRAGTTVTASVPGTENVADTDCGGAAVPGSKLSQGSWTAVLSYDSASTHGTSSPVEVQVP